MIGSADDLPLHVSWFETAMPGGPAFGDPEVITWSNFVSVFDYRREGQKDGPNFVPARFRLERDGRHVRRLKANLLARSAVALDVEMNEETGEIPPDLETIMQRAAALGWATLAYSSHNHEKDNIRYRVVLPLSAEIDHELPAPEVAAKELGLHGVLDKSKLVASSLFYLPSCSYDALDGHQTLVIPGAPIDAEWMRERAGALLAARQAEADRVAADAQAEAAARREAKIAAGFNPDDSLIENLRSRFDLDDILRSHGYDKAGTKYRHPNSGSGAYGADIKVLQGIERVFSHNGTDPLHASNLPAWCGGVTALDAFDVTVILDFGGDRTRAMRGLSERFGLTKAAERKALAGLLFRLVRQQRPQHEIEAAVNAEAKRQGLSSNEVSSVRSWVASQATLQEAA